MVVLLGIPHAERNGHHYFRGLDHLSSEERASAILGHPDLYSDRDEPQRLRITDGRISLRSLQVPGFGFSRPPPIDQMLAPNRWLASFSTRSSPTGGDQA